MWRLKEWDACFSSDGAFRTGTVMTTRSGSGASDEQPTSNAIAAVDQIQPHPLSQTPRRGLLIDARRVSSLPTSFNIRGGWLASQYARGEQMRIRWVELPLRHPASNPRRSTRRSSRSSCCLCDDGELDGVMDHKSRPGSKSNGLSDQ